MATLDELDRNKVYSPGEAGPVSPLRSMDPAPKPRDAFGYGLTGAASNLTTAAPYAIQKALIGTSPAEDAAAQAKLQAAKAKQEEQLPGGPTAIGLNGDLPRALYENTVSAAPLMASSAAAFTAGSLAGGGPETPTGLALGSLAAGATAFPQEVGQAANTATQGGAIPLTEDAANRSIASGAAASALDAGVGALGMRMIPGVGHGFTGNFLTRAAKGGLEGAALGGVEMPLRTAADRYAGGQDLTSDDALQQYGQSALGGVLLGGTMGGALGGFNKAKTDLLKPDGSGPEAATTDVDNPTKMLAGPTYSPDELHPAYSPNPEVNNGLALPAPGAPPEPPTIFAENPTKKLTGPPDQPVADPNQNNPSASPNPQGPPGLLGHGQVGRTDGVPDMFGGNGVAPSPELPEAKPQVLPTEEVKGLFTQANIAAELRAPGDESFDPHTRAVTSALTKALGEDNPDGADAYIARKTKEIQSQDGVEDPAILAKKQAVLDRATQVVQAYREHMADATQREEALTNPNIQTPPDNIHPAVASALANTPTHPNAETTPPVMVDPVQHAKMIRDAEKEALAAHEHEQKLQEAMEKQRQRAADREKVKATALQQHADAVIEHTNRKALIDHALNNTKINDPAGWVIAHLKRYNFENKDLTPLERQRIAEHERNNLRLDGAEPMGNPKEGEDVPRAPRAPESPDFADTGQGKMFDKNGKVLPKVRQEGPTNKDMETERAKAHTAAEAISNVRAEIEAKPDAPNSEVVDAIAHGIRQITDNVPAKDRLEALSVLKNEHGERLFNAAMERADSMKDEGEKPASETNKDKIQSTQPEPKAEAPKIKAETVRDRAVEAYKNGYLTDAQRRMVEAALETGSHTPEEINKHIDSMVEKSGFNSDLPGSSFDAVRAKTDEAKAKGQIDEQTHAAIHKVINGGELTPAQVEAHLNMKIKNSRNAKAVVPNRREVLGAGAAAATVGVGPKAEAATSARDTLASMIKNEKVSNTSILDHIAKVGTPLQRIQAALLRKLPGVDKILRDYAVSDEHGNIDPKTDPYVRDQLKDSRGTAGLDPENKHYMLFNDSKEQRSDGMNPEVFLHEMFHAVIQQRYGMLEDYHPTSKTGRAADAAILEWNEKWKRITEGLKQNVNLEEIGKTDTMAATGLSEMIRSPDEALSWVNTNENTRAFLDTIDMDGNVIPPKSPKMSVWDHIVDFVKKLLGIKDPEQVSALEELMKTSDKMMSHARLDEPDLKEYMAQPGEGHDDAMRKSNQMFVSKDARDADRGRLAEAKVREAAGQDAGWHSDIHNETGWHKTPGGDWAYEVSDHDAAFHGSFKEIPEGTHKLSDVFTAPEAFHAYPELKDIVIEKKDLGDRVGGRFIADENKIVMNSRTGESEAKNTILHEMQHWVQNKEDFARGGNEGNQVSNTGTLNKLEAFYKDRIDSLQSSYDRLRRMVGDDMSHTNIREYYERSGVESKEAGRMATRERNNVVMAYRTAQDRLKYVGEFRDHAEAIDKASATTRDTTASIDKMHEEFAQMGELTREHVEKLKAQFDKAKASGADASVLKGIRDEYNEIKKLYGSFAKQHSNELDRLRGERADAQNLHDVSRQDMLGSGLATDAYNNLAGEVQARATGDSADLTPFQRKNRNPYTDQGVKPEHQLITRDKVDNDSVRSPEEHDEPVEHLTDAMNRSSDAKPGPLPKNPMARGAADMALNMNDTTRRGMLNLRTMEQLAERYKHLPMIKAIKDMLDVQARERDDLIRAGGIIHHLGRALPKEEQDGLSLVFDAERHQVDVLDPSARNNIDNSPEAKDIHARFAKLSPAAQDVYRQMIEAGKAKAETAKKIYAETINGMTNLDDKTKARLISQMEAKFSRPVYFPHVWDGDFITIGKSDEFRAAEKAGDQDTLEKLRTDGNHYIVRASKTAADQRALIQALREEGMDVNIKKRESFQPSTDIVPDKFMRVVNQGLDDHIRANPDMAEGLRGMKEMLNETRYAMMPDGSQLANKFKRKGVQGFETDALGVFARTTKRDADYLTKLKYNTGVRQELDDLSVKARENQSNADMDVAEQMRKHFNSLGKYHNSSASKILNNLTYAYYLGMSPSFMVMHLMQTPMITAPWLGARFDAGKVAAALAQAGSEGAANYRRLMKNEGNEQIFGKTADEKEALKYAASRGLFQATQAHSLLIDAAGGGKMDHIAAAAMHVASFLPHHTERFNRLVTFQAAYRLAMEHPDVVPALDAETHAKASGLTPGKFDLNPQQLAAARFAQDAVNTTHVDYSGHNAAHIMQPGVVPFGEVMFQFQKYQQGMLSILGDSLADVFSKKSAAEKWVAGKTLAGILTSHAAVTGLMGLPLVGTAVMLSNIYHKFFGDKDKPFDGDDAIQRAMIKTFGPTWGEVALRGMLYAPGIKTVAPVDVTDRLGLGDVLAPTRQVGKINHDEWLKYIGSIAGGPSGSLLGQFADAYDYHEHGDDWKASEELMPKVMRDISRTIRFYNEGVTSKSGNEVIPAEDMQKGPAFAQLAGFEPQNMQETYANRRAVQNAQAELQERRKVLLKEATDARSRGDQAGIQRAMAAIQRYNEVRQQQGDFSMRIKGSEIMRSFKTRQKNNASLDHGVALKHSQQDLGMYSLGEGSQDDGSDGQ